MIDRDNDESVGNRRPPISVVVLTQRPGFGFFTLHRCVRFILPQALDSRIKNRLPLLLYRKIVSQLQSFSNKSPRLLECGGGLEHKTQYDGESA